MENPTTIRLQMLARITANISANLAAIESRQQSIRAWIEEAKEIVERLQKQENAS